MAWEIAARSCLGCASLIMNQNELGLAHAEKQRMAANHKTDLQGKHSAQYSGGAFFAACQR